MLFEFTIRRGSFIVLPGHWRCQQDGSVWDGKYAISLTRNYIFNLRCREFVVSFASSGQIYY